MGKKEAVALVAAAALLLLLWGSKGVPWASPRHHRFKPGDPIPIYGSKVGSYHNPSETYRYSDLPFCSPEHVSKKREFPGEALVGAPIVDSAYELIFRVDYDSKFACKKLLTKEDVARFRNAVIKHYYLEMFFDDLPIWAFLGSRMVEGETSQSKSKYLLYNIIHFNIFYNNDSVIEIYAQIPHDTVTDITEDKEIEVEFSYTVKWSETSMPFEKRMEKYTMSSLSYYWQFHWFSTIISCSLVLFLTIFLAMILVRILKNDFVKSLLCGGSTGVFIYGYCFYYYYVKTEMSGLVQTSFLFGYMACICYGIFLMLGTVGFLVSLFFVRHIYKSIKCE